MLSASPGNGIVTLSTYYNQPLLPARMGAKQR